MAQESKRSGGSIFPSKHGTRKISLVIDTDSLTNTKAPEILRYKWWRKIKNFRGIPKMADFQLETGTVPDLKEGEILTKAVGWPVLRYQKKEYCPLGSVMVGEQLARVIASKNDNFQPQNFVLTLQGWRSHSVFDPSINFCQKIPGGYVDLSPMRVMNILGLTGLMLYFGLTEITRPDEDDAIVVSCDSVFVGAFIAQLADIEFHCSKVIVFTDSSLTIHWMKNRGFNMTFDCKNVNPCSILERYAPDGIDILIDTIGTTFMEVVLPFVNPDTKMLIFGHSSTCFSIYGCKDLDPDPYRFFSFINLRYSSHNVFDFRDQFDAAQTRLFTYLTKGKFKLAFKSDTELDFSTLPLSLKHLYDKDVFQVVNVFDETTRN